MIITTVPDFDLKIDAMQRKLARADARIADMTTCALRNIPADWRPGYAWTDDCVMNVLSEYVVEIQDRAGIADARIAELERECEQWRDELRIYRETENKRIAELDRLLAEASDVVVDAHRYLAIDPRGREFEFERLSSLLARIKEARAGNGGEG